MSDTQRERDETRLQQIEEWGHLRSNGSRRCPESWAPAEGEYEALLQRLGIEVEERGDW